MWYRPDRQTPIERPKLPREVRVVPATPAESQAAMIREIVRQVLLDYGLIDPAAEDE